MDIIGTTVVPEFIGITRIVFATAFVVSLMFIILVKYNPAYSTV